MTMLQGTTIPHSYGFYAVGILLRRLDGILLSYRPLQFNIPSGEEVIGHVMEEIGGLETTAYLQKITNNPDAIWALRTPSQYFIIVSREQYRDATVWAPPCHSMRGRCAL